MATGKNSLDLYDEGDWNDDVIEDLKKREGSSVTVSSRDWTVETMMNQIEQGHIELNPKFQRRNAWTDDKRSRLIESLILEFPVPEIVLAQDPNKKGSFIVIDGKQRLLTVAGFINPEISYWDKPTLQKLSLLDNLNGKSYTDLQEDTSLADELRIFKNADLRCTLISNYDSDDVLYNIFWRLNAGSVPLSTQELRQALKKGPFADYLIEITNEKGPIHEVLGKAGPDKRLYDVELILRCVSVVLFGDTYKGNLKSFLDKSMEDINKDWVKYKPKVRKICEEINDSIGRLFKVFGENVGNKFVNQKWESRFNKVLFEVQVYYFLFLDDEMIAAKGNDFLEGFKKLCAQPRFRSTIESTTKTNKQYELRYKFFENLINRSFEIDLKKIPIK